MFVFARIVFDSSLMLSSYRNCQWDRPIYFVSFSARFGRKKTYLIMTGAYESELRSKRSFDFYGEK